MKKAQRILEILAALRCRFGSQFQVVDHWECDLTAVGVASVSNADRLVYLSILKRKRGRFYVDLVLPAEPGDDRPYRQGPTFDDVGLEELVAIVAHHLDIRARSG